MNVSMVVNGTPRELEVEPRRTLADVLRDQLALTGTHLGCEQGACGACTVILDGEAVRACLLFAVQCDGASVTTVEGLAAAGQLHPVQQALVEEAGLQCGFCTPGFATLLAAELDRPGAGTEDLGELIASNLCRCTGYRGILAAARRVAAE